MTGETSDVQNWLRATFIWREGFILRGRQTQKLQSALQSSAKAAAEMMVCKKFYELKNNKLKLPPPLSLSTKVWLARWYSRSKWMKERHQPFRENVSIVSIERDTAVQVHWPMLSSHLQEHWPSSLSGFTLITSESLTAWMGSREHWVPHSSPRTQRRQSQLQAWNDSIVKRGRKNRKETYQMTMTATMMTVAISIEKPCWRCSTWRTCCPRSWCCCRWWWGLRRSSVNNGWDQVSASRMVSIPHLAAGSLSPGFNLVKEAQVGVRATLRLRRNIVQIGLLIPNHLGVLCFILAVKIFNL